MSKRYRPTPAFALAFVALLVALTSSAVAGVPAQIARAISGSSIKSHSISGSKLHNNTLTGKQIAESKLSIVPKAKKSISAHTAGAALTAGSAGSVGGLAVHKIEFNPAEGTNPSSVLNVGGVNVSASCSSAGAVGLSAASATNDSDIRASVIESSTTKSGANTTRTGSDVNFDAGQAFSLTLGASRGSGTMAFVAPSGGIVRMDYSFHSAPSLGESKTCLISGVAFSG